MHFLSVHHVRKLFQHVPALDDVSFDLREGSITGLIGPNGSGKSTFFNVLMNTLPKSGGEIYFQGKNITKLPTHAIARLGITRTFQDSRPLPQISVEENIDVAFRYQQSISLKNVFLQGKKLDTERQEHMKKIAAMLQQVRIPKKRHVLAKDISYGQGKLLEILKVMVADPQLILLDEPFSGLFPEMITLITQLIRELTQQGKTIMLVEHNMHLIGQLCDHVIVLDAGKKIAEGTFAKVTKDPKVIESYLGK